MTTNGSEPLKLMMPAQAGTARPWTPSVWIYKGRNGKMSVKPMRARVWAPNATSSVRRHGGHAPIARLVGEGEDIRAHDMLRSPGWWRQSTP